MSAAAALLELPAITVDWECAFTHPVVREAMEYWTRLRGDRDMPARSELSPAGMRGFLHYMNLMDIDPRQPNGYIISLESSHTREVFGQLAKRSWREVFTVSEQDRWRYCFDLVRNRPMPVRLATRVGTQGQTWLDCEALIAPLSGSDGVLQSFFWIFVSWRREKHEAI